MQQLFQTDSDNSNLSERIMILYRSLKIIITASFLASSLLTYTLWDLMPHNELIIWLSLVTIVSIIRTVTLYRYHQSFKPDLTKRYGFYASLGSFGMGLLWGVAGFLFFPEQSIEHQFFILILFAGMGAASMVSLHVFLPSFYSYLLPMFIPVGIKTLSLGDSIHISLGIMVFAYVAGLCYFGYNFNRSLVQSIRLRFENIDLVEQLRAQKAEAERANIAKSHFLAAASHDLRQPLHALTLFTSVLDETIQYPKVRHVVDQIKKSVDALQNLFNALLDISRLDAGVMKVEKTDFYLQTILEKLANDFDPQASEKGLHINWPTCTFCLHTDQNLLEQILRNYISNALRYTDNGEITITCETNEDAIKINIVDTGPGIAEEKQQLIFEEFRQLNNPERDRSKGLGLGLAIVQRTARLLGHPIAVESQLGKGSTFSITVDQANITENATGFTPNVTADTQQIDNLMIMVIDDELSVREGTQNLLELWGYDVITAADKEEAITQTRQYARAPDGIIADYRLRENHTGVEAIDAIRTEFNSDIPALIVTGDIETERLRELNDGGFQMLHKPVAPAKLRAFLRHIQLNK